MEFTSMYFRPTFSAMKQLRAKKISGIFIGWTFVVLLLVLVYWLSREFMISKQALLDKFRLEYYQEVIEIAGIDVEGLIPEMSDMNTYNTSIEITKNEEWQTISDLDASIDTSENKNSYTVVKMVSSELAVGSSEDSLKIVGIGLGDEPSFMTKLSDSVDYASFDLNLGENQAKINQQALVKILPQCFISLLLILSFYGVVFTMRKRFEEQDQNQRAQSQMISNIAHELRTPISTVSVALEAIQNFGMSNQADKMAAYISTSRQQLGHLDKLVDKVIQLGRFEQESQLENLEIIDPNELLDEVVSIMSMSFEERGASLNIASKGSPGLIMGDRLHLKNALLNLLDNSLKYGPKTVKVGLHLRKESRYILMEVDDNGPGIPNAYASRVFERFFRVPTGDRHDVKGYGLGLSYVQEVVKMHGGMIDLISNEGEGTRILIKIPIHED